MDEEERNYPTEEGELEGDVPAEQEASMLNRRTLLIAVAGLVALVVFVHIMAGGIFAYFLSARPPGIQGGPAARVTQPPVPEPRLQVAPEQDLQNLRATEHARLEGYGWIDREAGVVRIPIERAMQLIGERGLPVVTAGAQAVERVQADESGFPHPTAIPSNLPGLEGSSLLEVTPQISATVSATPVSTQQELNSTLEATESPGTSGTPEAFSPASEIGFRDGDHDGPSNPVEGVGFDQKLNVQAPLELSFKDESGKTVQLGELVEGKPTILLFAYYECPMLCTLVLNNLAKNLKAIDLDIGRQFEVITVSMDPREGPELAAAKKAAYLKALNRPGSESGWHFLTGDEPSIQELANAVGFRYVYDPDLDQYAHPTGVMVLTPDGRVARYFLGIEYPAKDLRLGLVEASAGEIGTPVDQFFLMCYAYDPASGRYTLSIMKTLRLAGVLTVLVIGAGVLVLAARERRAKKSNGSPSASWISRLQRNRQGERFL